MMRTARTIGATRQHDAAEPPSAEALARGLKELELVKWLSRFDARHAMIVADPEPLGALGLGAGPLPAFSLTDLAVPEIKNKAQKVERLFVLDTEDEPAAIARVRELVGHAKVFGLVSDVSATLTLGLETPDDRAGLGRLPFPDRSYAVLCTARSGSTWFCHLLQNTGLIGHPKEHLRPPVVFLARHAARFGFSLAGWADDLRRAHARNGVFGTKIIDNFIDDILPAIGADDRRKADARIAAMAFIHFERRDKVAQAVSKYMAGQTRVWHVRHEDKRDAYRQKVQSVDYDGPAIKAIHDGLVENETRYRAFLEASGARVLHLTYEDALADPEGAVGAAVAFVRREDPGPVPAIHRRYFPLAEDRNAAFATRLRADYDL